MRRRTIVLGVAALLAGSGAVAGASFRRTMAEARARIAPELSELVDTRHGALEYAKAGEGPPVMMLHGTGGGFDQGLYFTRRLLGWEVIAPPRFGYLRSELPADPGAFAQAEALADLLDRLGIDRIAVAGGSAGAIPALAFALRFPDRTAALIPIVPAAYVPGSPMPAPWTPVQRRVAEAALGSDLLFWAAIRAAARCTPVRAAGDRPVEHDFLDMSTGEILPTISPMDRRSTSPKPRKPPPTSQAHLRALASTVRQDIVDTLQALGAASVPEVAAHMDRASDSLYYHVRALLKAGLIRRLPEDRRSGRHREAVYTMAGADERLRLSYQPGRNPNAQALSELVGHMLRASQREFDAAITDADCVVAGPRRELWAGRTKGWLSAQELERCNALLSELSGLLSSLRTPERDRLFCLQFMLTPARRPTAAGNFPPAADAAGTSPRKSR